VCNENIEDQPLVCGHHVHWLCIARSGKTECPLCRQLVEVPLAYREILSSAEERNRRAAEEANREAAAEIAEELNNEDDEDDHDEEERREPGYLMRVGHRVLRWEERRISEMTTDLLFEELASIHYAEERTLIECDPRVMRVARLMYQLKEESVLTNTSMRVLTDIMLTLFEE
jgi:hypothetical protein